MGKTPNELCQGIDRELLFNQIYFSDRNLKRSPREAVSLSFATIKDAIRTGTALAFPKMQYNEAGFLDAGTKKHYFYSAFKEGNAVWFRVPILLYNTSSMY